MTKQKPQKSIDTARVGHFPTKERRRHNGGVTKEIAERDAHGRPLAKRYRANWECPLDAYKDWNLINQSEYQAGLRFREAYYRAVLCQRAALERLHNYPTSIGLTMSERLLNDTYKTLSPYNKGAVIDICGYDRPAKDAAMFDKLKKGLGHLAVRWNMAAIEVCEHKPKTI